MPTRFFSRTSKLTDEALASQKPVEFWNITGERRTTTTAHGRKTDDFVDNSEVPPLE